MLLAVAGFASQAQVRVTDSLLPQIAAEFHTAVGAAAIVVTAYAIAHGSVQLIIGPFGDRLGKYRTVALTCAIGAVMVALCGLATSLPQLALARFATGAMAGGWVIPISMAFVGDVTPYEQRQTILGRYLTGQILGQLFGQAMGGVLGDLVGWRNVFFVLSGIFAIATVGLLFELVTNPLTRDGGHSATPRSAAGGATTGWGARFAADYGAVLSNPFARLVIAVAFIENVLVWGAFAYIGAHLRLRFGLSFTLIGMSVGCFGIGGLIYAGLVKLFVYRLGQVRLATTGGFVLAGGYMSTRRCAGVVARAAFDRRHRTRLLHAAQHAADQRHADDTARARHGRGDFLVGDLHRPDRRRVRRLAHNRPIRRGAVVYYQRGGAAGPRAVVRARIAALPRIQIIFCSLIWNFYSEEF